MPDALATAHEQLATADKQTRSLRIGKRYRASRVDDNYDAIVIGSGPGGLSTAACLSKMGKKVAVLEQHFTAGGFTHAYARRGYEWEVGVHFMNDVVNPDHLFRKVFDFISNKQLQWSALAEEKLHLSFGEGERIAVSMLASRDIAALKQRFPDEAEAISAIYAHAKKISDRCGPLMLAQKLSGSGLVGRLISRLAIALLPKDALRSTEEVIGRFTQNEQLIAIMSSLWVAAGVTPDQIPYFFLAGAHLNETPLGFPVGGSVTIAKQILPVIAEGGGQVFTFAKVEKILLDKHRVCGVRMADGHDIKAPVVVSNAGTFNTFRHLLPAATAKRYGYEQKLKTVNRSCAHFNLFVGFKGSNEELGLSSTDHLIFNSQHCGSDTAAFSASLDAPLPVLFLTFASAKDPNWSQRYPGKATASIFAYTENFDHFAPWRNERWEKRGRDYDAIKENIAQRMLEKMFQHYPQLRDKVDYYEISTPVSTRHFCMYEQGEIYGVRHDAARFRQGWLKATTQVPGLYLCGQDAFMLGHTASALSGVLCASKILGWRKARQLLKRIVA